jgi:hypothetical protein
MVAKQRFRDALNGPALSRFNIERCRWILLFQYWAARMAKVSQKPVLNAMMAEMNDHLRAVDDDIQRVAAAQFDALLDAKEFVASIQRHCPWTDAHTHLMADTITWCRDDAQRVLFSRSTQDGLATPTDEYQRPVLAFKRSSVDAFTIERCPTTGAHIGLLMAARALREVWCKLDLMQT